MPSESYAEFQKNLTDVKRLVNLHKELSASGGRSKRGKRKLGHLTRAGLVLLCAAWERYAESVAEEGLLFLARRCALQALPQDTRQFLHDHVNAGPSKSTYAHQHLTTNLPDVASEAIRRKTDALNTPKHKNLQPLFQKVGVHDIGQAWSRGTQPIDDFVSRRGEVAHRGAQSDYVRISHLVEELDSISEYAKETDNFLSDHLRGLVTPNDRPWNRKT